MRIGIEFNREKGEHSYAIDIFDYHEADAYELDAIKDIDMTLNNWLDNLKIAKEQAEEVAFI